MANLPAQGQSRVARLCILCCLPTAAYFLPSTFLCSYFSLSNSPRGIPESTPAYFLLNLLSNRKKSLPSQGTFLKQKYSFKRKRELLPTSVQSTSKSSKRSVVFMNVLVLTLREKTRPKWNALTPEVKFAKRNNLKNTVEWEWRGENTVEKIKMPKTDVKYRT